jgi:hypothetical protein
MTEKQIAEKQKIYLAGGYSFKKSLLIFTIISLVIMFSSCSRYVRQSNNGECGAWYPKKCKIGTKNW